MTRALAAAVIAAACAAAPLARAHPHPSVLGGREWSLLPTHRKLVALTFDGGGDAAGARAILRALRRAHVRGTFFLTGRWAQQNPRLAHAIGNREVVGNHTYDHRQLTALSDGAVRAEVMRAQRLLRRITGRDARPLFRFPYGARDPRTVALVNGLGYADVYWTVDTLGWEGRVGGRSASSVVARVLGALAPGEIVLMHLGAAGDRSTLDADALPAVIASLERRGYRFVTLDRFLR
jgi:peptidoglycan/xylan/chitin deacetylase (PgdA/CDA1 family)